MQQAGHQGAQAPIGDAGDREQHGGDCAARAWTRRSPNRSAGAFLPFPGEVGLVDPLDDRTPGSAVPWPTVFSFQQAGRDRTRLSLQLGRLCSSRLSAGPWGSLTTISMRSLAMPFRYCFSGNSCRTR